MVEQRRLAGAQEAGEHRDRDLRQNRGLRGSRLDRWRRYRAHVHYDAKLGEPGLEAGADDVRERQHSSAVQNKRHS